MDANPDDRGDQGEGGHGQGARPTILHEAVDARSVPDALLGRIVVGDRIEVVERRRRLGRAGGEVIGQGVLRLAVARAAAAAAAAAANVIQKRRRPERGSAVRAASAAVPGRLVEGHRIKVKGAAADRRDHYHQSEETGLRYS